MFLLSKYLVKSCALTTFVISLVLTMIIWLTQSLRLLDFIINGGAPMRLFLNMLIMTVPSFYEIILPISLAIGIAYSLNKFSSDSEIVVMQNSGISPIKLASGTVSFIVIVASLVFLISGWFAPMANHRLDEIRNVVRSEYSMGLLRAGVFNTIGNDTTFYIAKRTDLQDLQGVFIHFNKLDELPTTITAERGGLIMRDGKPFVVIIDGIRQQFNPETGSIERLKFQNYSLDISSLLKRKDTILTEPEDQTLSNLWNKKADPTIYETPQRLRGEIHTRLSRPLLTLCFGLLALTPFLIGYFNRRGNALRLFFILLGVISLQIMNLGASHLATENMIGVFLLYIPPMIVCVYFLLKLTNHTQHGGYQS